MLGGFKQARGWGSGVGAGELGLGTCGGRYTLGLSAPLAASALSSMNAAPSIPGLPENAEPAPCSPKSSRRYHSSASRTPGDCLLLQICISLILNKG